MNFAPRFVVWERAVTGWLERPLLGWGPENFNVMFQRHFNPVLFLPEYGQEIWFDRAHNIIVDTLVTVGIVGLLAYFGIFLATLLILWQNYQKKRTCFWTAAAFSSLLAAYFVQNLTVFDKISSYEKSEILEVKYVQAKDFYRIYLMWGVLFWLLWLALKTTFMNNALED